MSESRISIIAAVAQNGIIGKNGTLPWRLPEDLKRFKRLTTGHPIIMGRKTWEEVGKPLPGRTNIVLTRSGEISPKPPEGVIVVQSLEEGIRKASESGIPGAEEVFIIGGATIYEAALSLADRIYLTRVQAEVEGDVCFPEVDWEAWRQVQKEAHPADERHDFEFIFLDYERVR